MPHAVYTRNLSRSRSWRKATVQSLAHALLKHEKIETTLAKAKEAQRLAEKLITLGKDGSLAARRRAIALLGDPDLVGRLFSDVAPRFSSRKGGYTRILHGGFRHGDGASMAVLQLVELAPDLKRPPSEKREKEPREVKPPVGEPTQAAPKPKPEKPEKPEKPKKSEEKPKGFLEGLRKFFKGKPKQ